MKPVVGLDADGVFCDFMLTYHEVLHRLYPDKREVAYGGAGACDEYINLNVDDGTNRATFAAMTDADFLSIPPLFTEADRRAMIALDRHVNFVVVTHRPERVRRATWEWFNRNLFALDVIMPEGPKAPALSSYADLAPILGAIDDATPVVDHYATYGIRPYIRDWPYNRDCVAGQRVSSVEEFCWHVERSLRTWSARSFVGHTVVDDEGNAATITVN